MIFDKKKHYDLTQIIKQRRWRYKQKKQLNTQQYPDWKHGSNGRTQNIFVKLRQGSSGCTSLSEQISPQNDSGGAWDKTLPKEQRTQGLSSAYQSNLF